MHLPSQKLQLRPKLTAVLQHSSKNSTSKTPEAASPTKPASSINIKDKRNIKIGIAALRTVSKWTDKAALTLEKLEGQEASKHCQDRQARLLAEDSSKGYEKKVQDTGVWRDTVVYPVPTQVGSARGIEVHEQPRVYGAAAPSSKGEGHVTASPVEAPLVQTHHAHVLASVEEYYDESSDDEEMKTPTRKILLMILAMTRKRMTATTRRKATRTAMTTRIVRRMIALMMLSLRTRRNWTRSIRPLWVSRIKET